MAYYTVIYRKKWDKLTRRSFKSIKNSSNMCIFNCFYSTVNGFMNDNEYCKQLVWISCLVTRALRLRNKVINRLSLLIYLSLFWKMFTNNMGLYNNPILKTQALCKHHRLVYTNSFIKCFLHAYLHIFYYLEIVENTLYKDHGASVRFTKLNSILAKQFPLKKLEDLKFLLNSKCFLLLTWLSYLFKM